MSSLGGNPSPAFWGRVISHTMPVVVMVLMISGLWVVERLDTRRYDSERRTRVLSELSVIRANLEGELNGEILLARSLVTEVATGPNITQERFNKVVRHFMTASRHIRNLGLSRGTVLEFVYPYKGNEAAIGLDYRKIPDQWPAVKRAIDSHKIVVAGPLTLVQGGWGIIGRTPVFLPGPDGEPGGGEFFGIASIALDVPSLFSAAGLHDTDFMRVAIRGKDGLGERGEVFLGKAELFAQDPVLLDVSIPDGHWQLAALPMGGWGTPSPRTPYYRAVTLAVLVIVFWLFWIQIRAMRRQRVMEAALARSEERLRVTIEAAGVYRWEIDLVSGSGWMDHRWLKDLMGYNQPGEGPQRLEDYMELLHPDDWTVFENAVWAHTNGETPYYECDLRMRNRSGEWVWQIHKGKLVERDENGNIMRLIGVNIDARERKQIEAEREKLIHDLQHALEQVKTLSGLLPICASCKKIRDDKGYWNQIELYIHEHSEAEFSHGLCPDCAKKMYPDIDM